MHFFPNCISRSLNFHKISPTGYGVGADALVVLARYITVREGQPAGR